MHELHYADWQLFRIIRNKYIFVLISRQVYYADILMDLWNYSESSEINIFISICLNYLDRFILRYICLCQSHVFLCVFHYIASILYLITMITYIIFCQRYTGVRLYL